MSDPSIEPLRVALSHSPENLPLRRHLAGLLMSSAQYDEVVEVARAGLEYDANDPELRLLLAQAFRSLERPTEALVVAEELGRSAKAPTGVFLLLTRLYYEAGEIPEAVAAYKQLLQRDPQAVDPELSARLGVRPGDARDKDEAGGWSDGDERVVIDGRVRAGVVDEDGGGPTPMERPAVNFDDVGGMEALKEEIRMKIIFPMTHPEMYAAYGKKVGGGILMYGPPGCGKTHLARATAGQVNAGFIAVGINEVLDMWIGSSERNLHDLFAYARANSPCVLFFDEVDALGASRSDLRQSSGRQLINQFLAELDGVNTDNEGVLILAATNAPWHLDSAFRRPGRFDRILFVPPPDVEARGEILRVMLRGKPVGDVDFAKLAKKCNDFSGADLRGVLDQAIEDKLKEAMKTGTPSPLTTGDLVKAAKRVKPSTREWFSTARNHATYANQGGIYDDILDYLGMKR